MAIPDAVQPVEARHLLTQTITRPFTTITTVVTLGGSSPSESTPPPVFTPSPTPEPQPPTGTAPVVPASSSSSLTPDQIGAILGSVLGFVAFLLLVCCCLSIRRRRLIARYESDSMTETEVVIEDVYTADTWTRRGPTVVPPAPAIPPTPRRSAYNYRHTRNPQIRGVRRYP
ncbi:hypothetical protein B0T26DRAFT_751595 [Lasiosphaeria miniovina]|uniref:Uncharacterized protein n=1 Tax=Lasiosphaeria miniovina TaxID=1954250 RepID=A0AA40AKK3_9PEZI|nr:uncharacterized protein B0T26DRAFT_751595 [Lasiosphaeria miniovina]KAK0717557.1 hypothetical protein B0T26DRAFT_751595 [Lasiosphaeria miniovina]